MKRRVLIFGTFDVFHAGHQFVLSESAKQGTELIVAVARDAHVRILKNKNPVHDEQERLQSVLDQPNVTEALLSDKQLGTYEIVRKIKPDVIVFGFDQTALKDDLDRWLKEQNLPISLMTLAQFFYAPHVG